MTDVSLFSSCDKMSHRQNFTSFSAVIIYNNHELYHNSNFNVWPHCAALTPTTSLSFRTNWIWIRDLLIIQNGSEFFLVVSAHLSAEPRWTRWTRWTRCSPQHHTVSCTFCICSCVVNKKPLRSSHFVQSPCFKSLNTIKVSWSHSIEINSSAAVQRSPHLSYIHLWLRWDIRSGLWCWLQLISGSAGAAALTDTLVAFDLRLPREPSVTNAAAELFLSRVHGEMVRQVCFLREAFVTHWTAVWFLSCVNRHVFLQTSFLSEAFVTIQAAERFLPGVDSHVIHQSAAHRKAGLTERAAERFFSRVTSHVSD